MQSILSAGVVDGITSNSRVLSVGRTVPLIVALAILAYLFALLVPIVPVQQFTRCNGFSCPLTFNLDIPVNGGFTRNYLNSITRQLTGSAPTPTST